MKRSSLSRLALTAVVTGTSLALLVTPAMADPTPTPTPIESSVTTPADPGSPTPTEQQTAAPTTPASTASESPAPTTPATSATPSASTTPSPSAEAASSTTTSATPSQAPEVSTNGSITTTTWPFRDAPMRPAQAGAATQQLGLVPPTETTGFSLVGITWDAKAGSGHRYEVRVRSGGEWSQWYQLEPALAEAAGTDPIWVGPSDAVEAQVLGGSADSISGLDLVLIDPQALPEDQQIASAPMQAQADIIPVTEPKIVTRAQWGAAAPVRCEANSATIKAVTVHHTAGSNVYTAAQAPGIVRGIQNYHAVTLGWCDIGYNFLIDKYGTIYEGKAGGTRMPVHGAHAASWNDDTVGISFMMNSDSFNPDGATMEAAARLLAWKMAGYYLNPKGKVSLAGKTVDTIFRHGDVMATACPGANITGKMGWLRDRVAALMNPSVETPIYRAWQAAGGASGSYGQPVLMEAETPAGRSAGFAKAGLFQTSLSAPIRVVSGIFWQAYTEVGWQDNPLGFPSSDVVSVPGGQKMTFQGGEIFYNEKTGAWSVRGGLLAHYRATGATSGALGFPLSHETAVGARAVQRFQYGYVIWSASGIQTVYGAIATRYAAIGGPASKLGMPVGAEVTIPGGAVQRFEGGYIYWHPTHGAIEVWGAISTRYHDLGGPSGALGWPTTSEVAVKGGAMQSFQNGKITWSAKTGTNAIRGSIHTRFNELGTVGGRLGFPTGEESAIAGGSVQHFEAGSIWWSQATGPMPTWGALATGYGALNGPSGVLGFPTGYDTPIGKGAVQHFQHGKLYWSPDTPVSGTFGAIGSRYEQLGGPTGQMGFPSGTEYNAGAGAVQRFEGGVITWHPSTHVHQVWGAIGSRYLQQGGPGGVLGFPTSNENPIGNGVVQSFQSGKIYWSPGTPAASVRGAIASGYEQQGGASGRLGFPIATEANIASGAVQAFQGGNLYWSPLTPAVPVWGAILTTYQDQQGGPAGRLGFPKAAERPDGAGALQEFTSGTIRWQPTTGISVDATPINVPLTKVDVFINAVAPMAQQSQAQYGVPASVTMAQAILESGWGESELSRYGQAYFGVKCNSASYSPYSSGCVPKLTWEVIGGQNVYVWAHFRSYDSLRDSVLDHGYFLRNNSRYAPAFSQSTAAGFVRAIAAAGYATDPGYADKLIGIINANNLTRFDAGTAAGIPPVGGGIGTYYNSIGGAASALGVAVGVEASGPTSGGRMVSFNAGMITWSSNTGSKLLVGKIWDSYRLNPSSRALLGLPVSDQINLGGAAYQRFQGGSIYRTDAGTFQVYGGIGATYQARGGHDGVLGLPTSNETAQGNSVVQNFTGGKITWSPTAGVSVQLN